MPDLVGQDSANPESLLSTTDELNGFSSILKAQGSKMETGSELESSETTGWIQDCQELYEHESWRVLRRLVGFRIVRNYMSMRVGDF